jgi:hypothetical protein
VLINVNLDHSEKVPSLFSTVRHPLLSESTLLVSEIRVVALARMCDPTVVRSHESILKDPGLVDHPRPPARYDGIRNEKPATRREDASPNTS